MKNIVLIGMPGTGKSTVGKALAARLGYEFVDADDLIVQTTGKTLPEILRQDGLEAFYRIENKVGTDLNRTHTVIATGGSAVFGANAMVHLKEIGTVVYLKLSYEELTTRLGNLKGRGVVLRDDQTLKDLYEERIPLYEKYADVVIEELGEGIEETARKIIDKIR